MDQFLRPQDQNSSMDEYVDKIEDMYPENYKKIYPVIQDITDSIDDNRMYSMTQADLDNMTEQVVRKSNPHRDENLAREIARILILRELFDRHDRRRGFPFIPFFFNPFGGRDHRRRRGRFGR